MSTKKLSLSPSKIYLPYFLLPHLFLVFPIYTFIIFIACIVLFPTEAGTQSSANMDRALVYAIASAGTVLLLFILNTLLYVYKTTIEIFDDSFVITKGGIFFSRYAVPLTMFAANNLTQNPYQLLFGLTTFKIGLMDQHKLPGFNYNDALTFGQALVSDTERSYSFSNTSSSSKTISV